MKKLAILLACLVLALGFGTTQSSAQKKAKSKETITIEILAPHREEIDKRQVPVNRKPNSDDGIDGGAGTCSGDCPQSYQFTARAWRMGKDKVRANFQIKVEDGCETRKTFMVYRNQQSKLKLKCGIRVLAYY